ncbi:unnamed protein product [Rotaria sp. Silwood1]|nr:unnamed protein product [Rotaria sp. Silwood1]CAF3711416.1 unnamed protein product [Rotaria sp. Silwood1]CAF3749785.1 unnamed protein product [Rotaria sp. Silwood1]CAF4985031.1 unnamed protein product [Rotaria sp. Silwood1]CAF4992533.1 unnamed protein product [Rotaria sp. Silwood1]
MLSDDKDFRLMATLDLIYDLQNEPIKLDDDIQNQAVKCLRPLVCKIKEEQIEIICDTLCSYCTNMSQDAEKFRNIPNTGLKTIIASLASTNSEATNDISKKLMQRLLTAIQQAFGEYSQVKIMDIMIDMLSRFGTNLLTSHSQLKQIL